MADHNILLTSGQNQTDLEPGPMDDESFRKMAEERKRPRPSGLSLFKPAPTNGRPPVTLDQQTGQELVAEPMFLAAPNADRVWESLIPVKLDEARLASNGIFVQGNPGPATTAFDILRTRIVQAMQEKGWRKIAVTSPTHGCGKSFVAANLALSLARRPSGRTLLVDLELRAPALAGLLGQKDAGSLPDYLSGDQPLEAHVHRVGRTLALALNGVPVPGASELLQEPATVQALEDLIVQLDPQIAVYDVPPALTSDQVLALLPQMDAVLLVIDGTQTTAEDVRACERLFDGHAPLMGVVLNRAQDRDLGRYRTGRK